MATKANPIVDGEMRRAEVPFTLTKAEDDTSGKYAGFFTGFAAGIWNIDKGGDLIPRQAFVDDLPEFLKTGVVGWQHQITNPIGKPLTAEETDDGLLTRSRVSKTALGIDAMTLIRDEVVTKLSIGYRPKQFKSVDREGLVSYLDARADCPATKRAEILKQYDEMDFDRVFILEKIKLYEYSPVTIPMNDAASITSAKALMDGLLAGLPMKELSAASLAVVRGLAERAKEIHALRRDTKGTSLGKDRQTEIDSIAVELTTAAEELKSFLALIKADETAATGTKADPRALLREFTRLEARLNGVSV